MTPFSTLLASIHPTDNGYGVELPDDWQQGRTTFGGLTAALCVATAERAVPDLPPLRSAQFAFIGPVGGAVVMTPRLLRRGKSSAFVAVDLSVSDMLAAHATLSFGAARESAISYRSHEAPTVPAPETTKRIFRGGQPKFTQHFEAWVAGGQRLVSGAQTPELLMWLRHRDGEAMHTLAGVIALFDTLPTAAYTMLTSPAPASTVTWSIEIVDANAARLAPADAWYLLRSTGEDVREGYVVQNMELWSQDGTLMLLARQTVAIFG
jgi:acyl-CoA thioesterase